MAWLRLDDGFTHHPKFEGWTIAQRWAWLEVLEYCARYSTRGRIPRDLSLLPRSTSDRLLELAKRSGWINVDDNGDLWINDFETYNPPRILDLDETVAAFFQEHPDASANAAVKAIPGGRNLVLKAVKRYKDGTTSGTERGTESGTENGTGTSIAYAYPSPSTTNSGLLATRASDDEEPGPAPDDEPGPASNGSQPLDFDSAGQYLNPRGFE